MKSGGAVCVLVCVFSFCCAAMEQVDPALSVQELTVSGAALQACGPRKCVTSGSVCTHTAEHLTSAPEDFLNVSCRFLMQELSFSCRWIQRSRSPSSVSSFIFSQDKNISHCKSILNLLSSFSLTITSGIAEEQVSAVYPIILGNIVQAPQPVVTSVSVTPSSVWISWSSEGSFCRIRHRLLGAQAWIETPAFSVSGSSQYLITGLQAFSLYDLSVSCFLGYGLWSDWSDGTQVQTSESRPSESVSLSYYVTSNLNSGTHWLVLLWKALDVADAGGLIRGYEVTYTPVKRPLLTQTIHTTQLKHDVRLLYSEEYEVSVSAYNSAGRSPPRRLRVHPTQTHGVCALKDLWARSDGSTLRIRWDHGISTTNITEFAIAWSEAARPEHTHWQRVNGSTLTTHLTGVGQQQAISISVYPVCECVSGPPLSISADLQRGALLVVEHLALVSVSPSAVTVRWSWRETDSSLNVLQYRLLLSGASGSQAVPVYPEQQQHSFAELRPSSRFTVSVVGETLSRNFTSARLDVSTPAVDPAALMRLVVPLLLLLLVGGVVSVLMRTTCRDYFFPVIADPRLSPIGHWLLDPRLQAQGKVCVLKLDSVFLWDHLSQKDVLQVERRVSLLSHEDEADPTQTSVSSAGTALWKHTSDGDTHTDTLISSPPEYVDSPVMPDNADYVQAGRIPGVF